ncbi:MAG: RluA family pseudouridine synthase [Opitutaceae bacterium]|jgi:RluA family pseudouridine synthase
MASQRPTRSSSQPVVWGPSRILYEDNWLIVVDKPAGLPTQPTLDAARPSAFSELKAFLEAREGASPYLGLHHRLDRDTSGVLLLTKDPKANAGVGALFAEKTAQKTYQALAVLGAGCPDEWEVKNYLGIVGRVGKASKFGAVRSGGDPAQTTFRVLERFDGAALIEAQPRTGRTHQIRVHLAGCGNPILGDEFYGGPVSLKLASGARLRAPRVLLHASSLTFRHPITNAELTVVSPLPEDFVPCLEQLRKSP